MADTLQIPLYPAERQISGVYYIADPLVAPGYCVARDAAGGILWAGKVEEYPSGKPEFSKDLFRISMYPTNYLNLRPPLKVTYAGKAIE